MHSLPLVIAVILVPIRMHANSLGGSWWLKDVLRGLEKLIQGVGNGMAGDAAAVVCLHGLNHSCEAVNRIIFFVIFLTLCQM